MSGNERRSRLMLQARDRRLLEELGGMRVIDREQAKLVAGFASTSRANVRLLALARAGLLRRFFFGAIASGRKSLYALSAKGAKLVGVPMRGPRRRNGELLTADYFIEHQLAVNGIHNGFRFGKRPAGIAFERWIAFFAPLPNTRLIPDGYLELSTPRGTIAAFVEVDLGHESIAVWQRKIRSYLDYAVSGGYEREFGGTSFRVLVIANSERRMHSLRKMTGFATNKLFWFADLPSIRGNGIFASVWRRAKVDAPAALMQPTP